LGSLEEDREPRQIANYKPGISATIGIQYNLSRHISIQADAGIMKANKWFYDIYDGHNYTGWAVWDPVTYDLLAEGENELTMQNENLHALILQAGLKISFVKSRDL